MGPRRRSRPEPDRLAIRGDRPRRACPASSSGAGRAEVVMGRCVSGRRAGSPRGMSAIGLVGLPLATQGDAEVEVGAWIVGLEPDRLADSATASSGFLWAFRARPSMWRAVGLAGPDRHGRGQVPHRLLRRGYNFVRRSCVESRGAASSKWAQKSPGCRVTARRSTRAARSRSPGAVPELAGQQDQARPPAGRRGPSRRRPGGGTRRRPASSLVPTGPGGRRARGRGRPPGPPRPAAASRPRAGSAARRTTAQSSR